jgi:hypothetical protein
VGLTAVLGGFGKENYLDPAGVILKIPSFTFSLKTLMVC